MLKGYLIYRFEYNNKGGENMSPKNILIAESFFGKPEFRNISFTFEIDGIDYVVIYNSFEKIYDIRCLKYNLFVGFYLSKCKKDTDIVFYVAKEIIAKNASSSEKYPLNGEHYIINISGSEVRGLEQSETEKISYLYEKKYLLPNFAKLIFIEITSVFLSILLFQKYFYKLTTLIPSLPSALCYGIIVLSSISFPAIFFISKGYKKSFWDWFLIPFGWHSLLLLTDVEKSTFAVMCFVSLFIGVCYALAKHFRSFKNKEIKIKEKLFCLLLKTVKAIFVCIIAISLTLNISALIEAKHKNNLKETEYNDIFKKYETACEMLEDNAWSETTFDEKKGVLQAITDYECAITLKCSSATVDVKPMDDDLNGSYRSSSNTIYINSKLLETEKPITIISTLLHEVRHVYQHHICRLYSDLKMEISEEKYAPLLSPAITISENLSNYIDSSSVRNFFVYYNQPVETDARSWAKNEIVKYYSFITVTYV